MGQFLHWGMIGTTNLVLKSMLKFQSESKLVISMMHRYFYKLLILDAIKTEVEPDSPIWTLHPRHVTFLEYKNISSIFANGNYTVAHSCKLLSQKHPISKLSQISIYISYEDTYELPMSPRRYFIFKNVF